MAAAIGLRAFPVLPVGWHLLAERRRRRRVAEPAKPGKPPRDGLNAHDRFFMSPDVMVDRLVGLPPDTCRMEARTLAEAIQIGGTGETVTARGQLPVGSVASVLLCTLMGE